MKTFQFDHLLASQQPLVLFHSANDDCPIIDLRGGYEDYQQLLKRRGSRIIAQTERKARKLAREVGPLHFKLHESNEAVLQTLVRWKRRRIRDQGLDDAFHISWVEELIQRLSNLQTHACSGLLSVLYAGQRPVAAHLGMASPSVLNSWIPAHDEELRAYSPGLILHLHLARAASEKGITRIDLGRGMNPLKERLMTGSFPLAMGSIDLVLRRRALTRCWYLTRKIVYATPLRKGPLRLFRKLRNGAFRSTRKRN